MKDGNKPRPEPADSGDIDLLLSDSRERLKTLFPLPPRRRRLTQAARQGRRAALAACLLVAALVGWIDPAYRQETYASPAGSRQQLMLADGTRVDLDVNSRILVRWHLRTREVELLAGRALFSVSPARLRPFEVAAESLRIRVLGTQFDVRRQDREVAVKVVEGRVAVRGPAAARELVGGQQVASHAGQLGRIEAVSPESVLAWREGRLVFEQTPLSEALAELQTYLGQPLRAVGGAQRLAVSGVVDSTQVAGFLALLPEILPVVVGPADDGAIEVRPK